MVRDCGTIKINSVQWVLLPLKWLFCTQQPALSSITVNLKKLWCVKLVIEQQKEGASVQSACYQFVTEWFQDSNYIQSVYNNRAINCDKSVKIAIPFTVTYTDIHIKQKFTVTILVIFLSQSCQVPLSFCSQITILQQFVDFCFKSMRFLLGSGCQQNQLAASSVESPVAKRRVSVTLQYVVFPESVPIELLNTSDWD